MRDLDNNVFIRCHSFGNRTSCPPKRKLNTPEHKILTRGCNSFALPLRSHPQRQIPTKNYYSTAWEGGFLHVNSY